MRRWLFLAACFASACKSVATWDGYEQQLAAYQGHDVNELIMVLGEPTRRTEMERGHKVYVWEQMSQAHTPQKIVEQYNSETQKREFVVQGGGRIPFDCTTTVFVDDAGLITMATAEGVACLGIAPAAPAPVAQPASLAPVAAPPTREPVHVPETIGEDAAAGESETPRAEQRRARRRER